MSGLMLGLAMGLLNSLGGLLRYIRNWPIVAGMRLAIRSYGYIYHGSLRMCSLRRPAASLYTTWAPLYP
jgi:hypothetical protein